MALESLIDQRDIALYGAQYNAVAQAGKSLKRLLGRTKENIILFVVKKTNMKK
ncbi:hypothetical protein [Staphylococcus aureus]|uniref:hypothetical protein n=1 Tax=Staphylococcus aureus TaxID=1280 RepID=UPI001F0CE6BC|nr:hypothetical protein [Staphylococcus aureus]